MNLLKFRIFAPLIFALLTLSFKSASSQNVGYTEAEFQELIKSADTVIYIRDNLPSATPPYRMLIFDNQPSEIDWSLRELPRRPLFAIKTNLLYDAVTAVNVEVEVPIGNRYSVAAEWIFPWWLSDSRQRCFELLCATIEGRYWFGDRSTMQQLTGWAAGAYVGGGYYDLEWDSEGYQGEHIFSWGVAAAYAHPIGKNLRLEYSLGVGMLSTKYRKYSAQKCNNHWILLRKSRGVKNWWGPTRCRVSLSWMLQRADKRGGNR